ncbi:hypothetical protein GC194_01140 [bacterium]|nr:hypothetical protein [bacterium]
MSGKGLLQLLLLSGILSPFISKAQSPAFPNSSLSNYYMQRAEIKSGVLRNKTFFDIQPMQRDEGAYFVKNYTEEFVYGSDSANLIYVRNDNAGWTTNYLNTSKRPILKSFYKDPANLFALKQEEFQVFVNPVISYSQGYERNYTRNSPIFNNERGVEVRGNIAHKLGFYTYFSDNQARYPNYVTDYIKQRRALPGDGFFKSLSDGGVDHYTARGHITFDALDKRVKFLFGHNRNFIGNGIRSLILSDFSKDYLQLKINTKIWRFNYQNLYGQLTDLQAWYNAPQNHRPLVYPKKYYVSHYLSLDLLKNLNVGLYEGIVFHDIDSTHRGFDLNYLNPIIFYRAVEHSVGNSPDNAMIALNLNYLPTKGVSMYSQFLIDEFKFSEMISRNKWWGNKYTLQLGLKVIDLFDVKNLDYTLEYDMVRPYTYEHSSTGNNYINFNQPMAHPLGANFKEVINRIQWIPLKKLYTTATFTYSTQGLDSGGYSFGGNIYELYTQRPWDYGVKAGQGLRSDIYTFNLQLSYMLKHNFFIEYNLMWRRQNLDYKRNGKDDIIMNFGIRWNAIPKNLYF